MKRIFLVFLFAASYALQAQENSIPANAQTVLDSLNVLTSKQWLKDSLSVSAWADSLRAGLPVKSSSNINRLNNKIDSLNNLQLPTGDYIQKLDSLKQKKENLLTEVTNKHQALLGKTKNKLARS